MQRSDAERSDAAQDAHRSDAKCSDAERGEARRDASHEPTLDDVQVFIASHIADLCSLPKNPELSDLIAGMLTGNERLSPAEQLEIYRVQFWLRHTDSLLEDFPGVSGILGQAVWEPLVEAYLHARPSPSWTLRDLGKDFPAHIASFPDLPHRDLCLDMVHLEWAYVEIFEAEDPQPLDAQRLASLSELEWQSARFRFSKAVRLVHARYPVAELRRELRNAKNDGRSEPVAIPEPEEQRLLLYRGSDRDLYYRKLGLAEFLVLQRLMNGDALVPACEHVVQQHPELESAIEAGVGSWFADWGRRSVITDVV